MYFLEPSILYVAYSCHGYDNDFCICRVFPNEKMAKEYCQTRNKEECRDYVNGENRYIDEKGNVCFSDVDSEDFYYWYCSAPMSKPTEGE